MDQKKVFINDKIDLRFDGADRTEGMKFFDFLDMDTKGAYIDHPDELPKVVRFYKDNCEDILIENQEIIKKILDIIKETTFGPKENVWVEGAGWNYYFVWEDGDKMALSFTHLGSSNYYYAGFMRKNFRLEGLDELFKIDMEEYATDLDSDDDDLNY